MQWQIFGGLVWILVASTHVKPENPQGWVMFVSVFCFVMTFLWLIIFACGGHKNSGGWATAVRAIDPQCLSSTVLNVHVKRFSGVGVLGLILPSVQVFVYIWRL